MEKSNMATTSNKSSLTDSQRAQIERNRQRALLLQQSRILKRPIEKELAILENKKVPKVIDTGAGFLLEENDELQKPVTLSHKPGAILGNDLLFCEECDKEFMESELYNKFDALICDNCRSLEEKYSLISKTEAKAKYLLKDADLEKREPFLKYIVKKNPHNRQWGDMKLFLELQVAQRALEVWGSEESLEEERELRLDKRDKMKQKKFDKKVKELRKAVRSTLYKKDSASHEHQYEEEVYDDEMDQYSKTCKICGQTLTYEKM